MHLSIHKLKQHFDLLALHRVNPKRYPYLLESQSISDVSRFSILFAYPDKQIQSEFKDGSKFLETLTKEFISENDIKHESHLPFRGGWFVYLGYELAQEIEPSLDLQADSFDLPMAIATRVPAAIIIDHIANETWFVDEEKDETRYQQALADIAAIKPCDGQGVSSIQAVQCEDADEAYLTAVDRISKYIKQGDVFQVNLSRSWQVSLNDDLSSSQIYETLRERNPAPFAALANFENFSIISSSPERLVRVNNGIAETRPIAGTRPRGDSVLKDQALLEELLAHPKERAEHIMLIDLERNDLGRITKPGTVEVDELMTIESYEYVHHIVSNIRGELKKDVTPADVIAAVFPGGTITGCPKVRCMEIISELENTGRGPYTGSLGYINKNGDMDSNILIRTLVKKGQDIHFRTGAGIVFDSIPKNELLETRHKAKGLLKVFDTETIESND
ncbi:MAG: Para-aminobenzoate synthase, aminase component (EC [uncultured Thiotrichaceae bacterium]|uniref:Para-aminobenzoate synthase, aminase component (EC) n=1 Tax=uncultured Thiotrichaceae bacterium TaxID=298394 RepID=A0A6S6TQW7_9GAMM|nr:MAG: Para-aminobenzoate synthase, aminase component (EC [uncultured Thiotrichaceae bacterium]